MAEEKWVKIAKNTELHKGDIVKLHFALMSLFDWDLWYATQLAAIEAKLDKDPRFFLMSTTHPENGAVTFKVRIEQNPVAVSTLIAIIVGTVGVGMVVWLTYKGGERLEKVVAKTAVLARETGWSALKIGMAVLIGTVGFIWLKKT